MNAIVVTDKQWAIGRSGDLLFSLPGDMKHFRTLTTGGTVIMGRKTLDSFPGGRPLPKRENLVLTIFRCPSGGISSSPGPRTFTGRAARLSPRRRMRWRWPEMKKTSGSSAAAAFTPRCWAAAGGPPSPGWTAPYRMPTPFSPIWTPSLIGKLSGPARPSRKMT